MVKTTSQQAAILQVMGSPTTYGLANQTIERIDTHASVVFLAGDKAYKIKKEVKYPFLDFSNLEKRRLALVNELRLNRRTAPQIYLDLIPITSTEGGDVRLGGTGKIVEWALCMRRFDQDRLYDRMAAEGRLPLAAMPQLAAKIAELHRGADRTLTPEQAVLPLAAYHRGQSGGLCRQGRRSFRPMSRRSFGREAVMRSPLSRHCLRQGREAASSAIVTAICIFAISSRSRASRFCSMRSNSTIASPPSMSFTTSPFC